MTNVCFTFIDERVAAASRLVVLLQYEDPLPRLGHDGPSGHPPNTRPDDDGVKMLGNLRSYSQYSDDSLSFTLSILKPCFRTASLFFWSCW